MEKCIPDFFAMLLAGKGERMEKDNNALH
ncbi:uncharacterized protein G2W53_035518 [Senna tora]|uniref:Uncharacterized protein n=1 Tax=Senna tora TaxID=362788 RepID=A0A834W429_9FABA|nr:uncharacterized protein G2W53_035518 [Senna tora]